MKNIYKQYGKNIKAWEEREDEGQNVPKHIVALYKKYDLDLTSRKPFISIRHWRWDNCVPEDRRTDTFAKLEAIALSE
jgi:hypothetical protein